MLSRPTCWISPHPQGTPAWLEARRGRLCGSKFATARGLSKFETPEDLLQTILTGQQKPFTPEEVSRMAHGTEVEPKARTWFEGSHGCKVDEVGLAVWKGDSRLACSLDGEFTDHDGEPASIEIKGPRRMYYPLLRRLQQPPPTEPFYHGHIWDSHYDQMQGGMGITGKVRCYYIVFADDAEPYVELVPFNEDYWNCMKREMIAWLDENKVPPRDE